MEALIPSLSVFLLIFVRVTSFFVTMPIFSHRTIPAMHRVAFALLLSWSMYYSIDATPMDIDFNYILLIMREAMIGLLIGFIGYMITSAIQIAGGLIDFQMGFAIANVIDPQNGTQSPIMGQYLYMFALLLLLAVNGHHLILDGIFYSYQVVPIDPSWSFFGNEQLLDYLLKAFNSMFIIAFQMSIPIVACLFLVDIALGIVARTVPQLNIFVVGFPIKIGVSFIVLIIVMGVIMAVVQNLFETMLITMRNVMSMMGGS
jgi:flagellar biosynthetic protein FliR